MIELIGLELISYIDIFLNIINDLQTYTQDTTISTIPGKSTWCGKN